MCALIKFGAAVAGASGKSGGTVFARNKSGAYMRNWVKPINPNTAKQQTVRNDFAFLVSQWKSLSAADQQAWADMAPQYPYQNRIGEQSEYTGQQLYLHLNRNIQAVSATLLTRPAVPGVFSNLLLSGADLELLLGVWSVADVSFINSALATESVIIEATPSVSSGITKPAKGLFRTLQVETDGSAVSDVDVIASYTALYGTPNLGDRIYFRAWMIIETTGQRLSLGQIVATVTGT